MVQRRITSAFLEEKRGRHQRFHRLSPDKT
jgi:hypothetical protein